MNRIATAALVTLTLAFASGCAVDVADGDDDGGLGDGASSQQEAAPGGSTTSPDGSTSPDSSTTSSDGSTTSPYGSDQAWCASNTFVADLGGSPGTAQLGYELGLTILYVGGQIVSQVDQYYFSGCELPLDLYTQLPSSSVCWVDVTSTVTGERFRAELNFHQTGFVFTANAYEGAYSTDYNFICQ